MARVLIIGIGNPLRSDDGLGWRVVEEFSESSNLQILRVHQLTPEVAESLSQADLVIFLDAAAHGDPGTLHCEKIGGEGADLRHSHHVTPAALIEMARALYGKKPVGFLVSVAGKSFEHGDSLSAEIVRAIPQVVAVVSGLLAEHNARTAT